MRKLIRLVALSGALSLVAVPSADARTFGTYVDPWHVAEWAGAVGAAPQYVARFEAFSRGTTIDSFLREAERQGLRRVLVSWEPWRPVPPELGVTEQFRPQPGYTNLDVARGIQDEYILRFARSLATFRGRVDLRYAHEMNGTWYPWSHDPIAYRRAWRRVVRLFRAAGAGNVRFVWSVNPSLYLPLKRWQRSVRVYWPGRRYVDAVGSTMINFGGQKHYAVSRFVPRLRALRRLYRRPSRSPRSARRTAAGSAGCATSAGWCGGIRGSGRSRGSSGRAAARFRSGQRPARLGRPDRPGRRRGAARHHPRRASIAGRSTKATGANAAAHTPAIRAHTIHSGASVPNAER